MLLPMLELLESELPRDNMLSSTCLDILEVIRKVCGMLDCWPSRTDNGIALG